MSETQNQQEPSMEEILASIRRIISEDGQDVRPDTEEKRAGEPDIEPDQPADSVPEEPATEPYLDGRSPGERKSDEADVLVLTEMLAEDGSVVSLTRGADDSDLSVDSATESDGLPEPPTDGDTARTDGTDAGEAVPTPDGDLTIGQANVAPEAERPTAEAVAHDAAETPTASADQQMENEAVSSEARKRMDLVSEDTAAASTAALAELARTVAREREHPTAGGRMVEDLVREALQPLLREWLDANLPGLVERLVREEIQRLARRAEDSV